MSVQDEIRQTRGFRRKIIANVPHPELQRALDAVERELIKEADRDRSQGILVTRLDRSTFLAELTPEVPYGTTWERDLS